MTDEEAVRALVRAAVDELGRLDVMVNNAGVAPFTATFMETRPGRLVLRRELRFGGIRHTAGRRGTARAGLGMRAESASIDGYMAEVGLAYYNAAKAAVISLTKTTALEWASHGVPGQRGRPGLHRHPDEPAGARRPRGRGGSSRRYPWVAGDGPRRSRRPPCSCARRRPRSSPARCSSWTAARPSRARARPERVDLRGAVAVVTGASSASARARRCSSRGPGPAWCSRRDGSSGSRPSPSGSALTAGRRSRFGATSPGPRGSRGARPADRRGLRTVRRAREQRRYPRRRSVHRCHPSDRARRPREPPRRDARHARSCR